MAAITREEFLANNNFGMILRTYATRKNDVSNRVAMIKKVVRATHNAFVDGKQLVKRIDILVWTDKDFPESDCGETAATLQKKFAKEKNVFISEFPHGDIFCSILNGGVYRAGQNGIRYSIIISPEAYSYVTSEIFSDIVEAARDGALAIGVAIDELEDSVLDGRIANTFAVWNNQALASVGLFDLDAAKPFNEHVAHYLRGWDRESEENVYYHLAGVEEMIPLARLIDEYGPCVAPILPRGNGFRRYKAPDSRRHPYLYAKHIQKMETKLERQTALLASINVDISYLEGGVMSKYKKVHS